VRGDTVTATAMPRLGVTLMSFAREIHLGLWDLDACLERAGRLGKGTALELTGAQSLPGYPELLPDVADAFRNGVERHELVPTCYDAYLERGRRFGRTATLEEAAELILAELRIAHQLGFPLLRLNTATPELLALLLPTAERLGIRIVIELHGLSARNQDAVRLAEYFDVVGSPSLGFLQDLGAMMRAVPPGYLQEGRRMGVPEALVAAVEQAWLVRRPLDDVLAHLTRLAAGPVAMEWAVGCFVMFHRNPVEELDLVLPHLAHVHGKFFGIDRDGGEPSIDYPAVIGRLRAAGYHGVVSSEYISWTPPDRLDSLEQVAAHHWMVRALWDQEENRYRRAISVSAFRKASSPAAGVANPGP
jgi:sugar phosphate isomerase/epimerase